MKTYFLTFALLLAGSAQAFISPLSPVAPVQSINGQTGDVTVTVDAINNGTTTSSPSQNAVFDALALKLNTSAIASSISDSDTTHAPDGNSVFDALALKLNTSAIASSISDSDTTHAPDGNSVFDALALKLDTSALASSISDSDTTHAPDGNSVFDALALKQPTAYTPAVAADYGATVPTTVVGGLDGLAARQNCSYYSVTVASDAAITGADLLAASAVPAGKKPYVVSVNGYIDGSAFGSVTSCVLEDTSDNAFQTFDALDMGNDTTIDGLSIGTRADAFRKGTGGADGAGVRFNCVGNGSAGSSAYINALVCVK
jgi:hypothetical protein